MGGDTRISGFLLAMATAALLFIGTGPIEFIRMLPHIPVVVPPAHIIYHIAVMVVGSLIFVLGIDLVKEALWDTRHRVNRYVCVAILTPRRI